MSNDNQENLRTEYSAISQYHNSLVTFRLTLLGLFLAALGFLIGDTWPIPLHISLLGLFLTFCMYVFELRTRVLFEAIARRGVEIEQHEWKFQSKAQTKPSFFSLQYPDKEIPNYGVKIKIFGKTPIEKFPLLNKIRISHSVALDYLYMGLIVFFLAALILPNFSSIRSSQTQIPTPTTTLVAISATPSGTLSPTAVATSTVTAVPTITITTTGSP